MDVIIPAGGIPKLRNPLNKLTQGKPKAILDIAGKPMIQWVLDAVSDAKNVGQVAVVGLDGSVELSCAKPLITLPDQGSMIGNIRTGVQFILEKNPNAEYVMTVASDIPLVTGEILDWFIEQAKQTQHEFYINMVTRQILEARFPGVKRRINRVGNLELRGAADISIFQPKIIFKTNGVAERLERARGRPLRQLNFIGFNTLFLLMLLRLDLDAFINRLSIKHDVDLHPVICPYAEVGMDVDEPLHLEIMNRELAKRD